MLDVKVISDSEVKIEGAAEGIKPEHVRAALQSGIGKGLKCPSVDLEEYVAAFLNNIHMLCRR